MTDKKDKEAMLFPYDVVRPIQNQLIALVENTVKNKSNLIAHAPTGLGKTIATLGPALAYSLKNNTTVFFLTSRHTQHKIAIDTLKEIGKKFDMKVPVVDLIGKKHMCLQSGINLLNSGEFSDYCKSLREDGKCEFYENTKTGSEATVQAKKLMDDFLNLPPMHTEELIENCKDKKICPYEMAGLLSAKAKIVVADYYYMFHPKIRSSFMNRSGKLLENCIIIIDEGHNLPSRIRNLMSEKLSSFILRRAIKEAKKLGYDETIAQLVAIQNVINDISSELGPEKKETHITREDFQEKIRKIKEYDELVADLDSVGSAIKETQKTSSISSIASFLEKWPGSDDGFIRILSFKEYRGTPIVTLSYRCLDPALLTKDVIEESHSTILMSGTLNPTDMYADVLGFPKDTALISFKSPFPEDNKLTLLVPETTTRYAQRSQEQFMKIGEIASKIIEAIPGNILVYFPSYHLKDQIYSFFSTSMKKTIFQERPDMSKEDKFEMLEKFKRYNETGAALLAVSAGNYSEGIDLPGDFLKGVLIVGLPLQQPDLETKALIRYYDEKFGKGWDYGYISPAFSKCLQAAGRCIRSETDKGVVIYLDERFIWKNYYKHFPAQGKIEITKDPIGKIEEFFS